jgi:hypothetical protein
LKRRGRGAGGRRGKKSNGVRGNLRTHPLQFIFCPHSLSRAGVFTGAGDGELSGAEGGDLSDAGRGDLADTGDGDLADTGDGDLADCQGHSSLDNS